jgi:hypothetical protein
MNTSLYILHKKIEEYKAKFYKNQLIKGGLLAVSLLISAFIFVNFIEYFGRFGSPLYFSIFNWSAFNPLHENG